MKIDTEELKPYLLIGASLLTGIILGSTLGLISSIIVVAVLGIMYWQRTKKKEEIIEEDIPEEEL